MAVARVAVLGGLWLLMWLAASASTQHHVSPFFYLCSFQQPNVVDQSTDDVGRVALSVSIDGDPRFYVPGQLYNGRILSLSIGMSH